MLIGVPTETAAGETRVAVTPETAKKLVAQGHRVRVQAGAGTRASATDEAYAAAGAEITDAAGALGCDLVLKVRSPSADELGHMKSGTALVGMLNPFDAAGLQALAGAGLTAFALEAALFMAGYDCGGINPPQCAGGAMPATRPHLPVAGRSPRDGAALRAGL